MENAINYIKDDLSNQVSTIKNISEIIESLKYKAQNITFVFPYWEFQRLENQLY